MRPSARRMCCSYQNHSGVWSLKENTINKNKAHSIIIILSFICVNNDIRVHGCPCQPGVDVLAGGVEEDAREGQWWRQAVFIAELGWSHPVELLDFSEVHLGGHQHARDFALHVVLLSKKNKVCGKRRVQGGVGQNYCRGTYSTNVGCNRPCIYWHSSQRNAGHWCHTWDKQRHRRHLKLSETRPPRPPRWAAGIKGHVRFLPWWQVKRQHQAQGGSHLQSGTSPGCWLGRCLLHRERRHCWISPCPALKPRMRTEPKPISVFGLISTLSAPD